MSENAKGDDREHVVTYMYKNKDKFRILNIKSDEDYSRYRATVDTIDDYYRAHEIYSKFYLKNNFFGLKEFINFFKEEENEK